MAVFVSFDGDESYITQDRATHKYVPIRSEKQATRFPTFEKANNVLKSSIPKTIRSRYKITLVTETELSERDAYIEGFKAGARFMLEILS